MTKKRSGRVGTSMGRAFSLPAFRNAASIRVQQIRPQANTREIIDATAKVFDIDFDPFSVAPRTKTRQKATTVAIALISEIQGFSLTEIGERLNRDHASIHHHLKKFRNSAELKARAISVKNILGIYT